MKGLMLLKLFCMTAFVDKHTSTSKGGKSLISIISLFLSLKGVGFKSPLTAKGLFYVIYFFLLLCSLFLLPSMSSFNSFIRHSIFDPLAQCYGDIEEHT